MLMATIMLHFHFWHIMLIFAAGHLFLSICGLMDVKFYCFLMLLRLLNKLLIHLVIWLLPILVVCLLGKLLLIWKDWLCIRLHIWLLNHLLLAISLVTILHIHLLHRILPSHLQNNDGLRYWIEGSCRRIIVEPDLNPVHHGVHLPVNSLFMPFISVFLI